MARAKKFSPLDRPDAFAQALVDWFDKGGKDYPWRRTHDPYAVLVSELMLQQTQVATVLSRRYFENWLEKFPTPGALAQASEEEVLKAWEGLGCYRRARNLQKAVDGNVARVLARLFDFHEEIDSTKGLKALWAWAEQLVPQEGAREYNSGLMELGQTLCSVTDPQCGDCPVAAFCLTETPSELPKRKPRVKTTLVDEHVRLVVKGGRVLLEQESGKRREGLWKLPELPESKLGVAELLHEMKYSITRYRVTLHVYADRPGQATPPQGQEWFDESQIAELAMPSPYRKALVALAESGRIFA